MKRSPTAGSAGRPSARASAALACTIAPWSSSRTTPSVIAASISSRMSRSAATCSSVARSPAAMRLTMRATSVISSRPSSEARAVRSPASRRRATSSNARRRRAAGRARHSAITRPKTNAARGQHPQRGERLADVRAQALERHGDAHHGARSVGQATRHVQVLDAGRLAAPAVAPELPGARGDDLGTAGVVLHPRQRVGPHPRVAEHGSVGGDHADPVVELPADGVGPGVDARPHRPRARPRRARSRRGAARRGATATRARTRPSAARGIRHRGRARRARRRTRAGRR